MFSILLYKAKKTKVIQKYRIYLILTDNAFPDKFGLDRVMEALEANMWPTMDFKTQQRPVKTAIVEVRDLSLKLSLTLVFQGIEEDFEVEITRDNDIVQVTETTITTTTTVQEEEPSKPKLSKTERRERALQREAQEKAKQVKKTYTFVSLTCFKGRTRSCQERCKS